MVVILLCPELFPSLSYYYNVFILILKNKRSWFRHGSFKKAKYKNNTQYINVRIISLKGAFSLMKNFTFPKTYSILIHLTNILNISCNRHCFLLGTVLNEISIVPVHMEHMNPTFLYVQIGAHLKKLFEQYAYWKK